MAEDMAAAGPERPVRPGSPVGADAGSGGEPGEAGGTGDARVDEAIAPLGELADVPLEDHPAIFERMYDRLREVLGELNPAPADRGASAGPASSAGPAGPPGNPGGAGAP